MNARVPTIDEVVPWAQSAMQKIYLVGEELEDRDVRDLPIPQYHVVSALSDLIESYRNETSGASHCRALSRPL